MDLSKTGVAKQGPLFMGSPRRRYVASFCIGRQIKYVAVTSCAQDYRMGAVGFNFTCDQVTRDDPSCLSIGNHYIEHFAAVEHFYFAVRDLPIEDSVRTQQKMMTGLATRIERPGYLGASKGAVG